MYTELTTISSFFCYIFLTLVNISDYNEAVNIFHKEENRTSLVSSIMFVRFNER